MSHLRDHTPRQVISRIVLPTFRGAGGRLTLQAVTAANRRHGPTVSGGVSDHQGPGWYRFAADMASSHAVMDETARRLTNLFAGSQWSHKGLHTFHWHQFVVQVIWQAPGHFDHVHCGLHLLNGPAPSPRYP